MNTKFPSVLYWSKVAISGVILGFSLLGAQAWVPAPGSPPMSDVRGPITTGSDAQVKNGPLGISGLLKAYSGIDANGKSVANVAAPVGANDAATKAYVDAAGGASGSGGSSIPTGTCQFFSVKTNAFAGGYGGFSFKEGEGCYAQCDKGVCPFMDSCLQLSAGGYRCLTISKQGDCNAAGQCTSATLTCMCYKL